MERGYAFVMVDLRGLRRLDRLPRLGRARRAVRRRQRGPVGGLAAVVDRQGRHVRQVLRRRHRPDRRRQAARRARRRRLPGAGLRPLPLPLRRRDAARERVPHPRAVRPDRRHAGPDHRRPELQRRRRQRHPAPRLPGRQLRRPGRQRRPRLGVLEGAQPDPGRHRLGRAAVPHAGADGEQHGRRRHRPVPAEPHRLRARLARPVGARARQRDRRERPPEDGPRRLVRRGHALLRPVPQGRRADGRRPADRGPDQRRQVARRAELAAGRLDGVHDAAALRHLHRRRHRQRDRRRRGEGRLDDLAAAGARRPPVGLREREGRRDDHAAQRQPRARRLRPRRERHRAADHAPGPPDPQVGDDRPRPVVGGLEDPGRPPHRRQGRRRQRRLVGARADQADRHRERRLVLAAVPAGGARHRHDPGRPGHAARRLPLGDRDRAAGDDRQLDRRRASRRPSPR